MTVRPPALDRPGPGERRPTRPARVILTDGTSAFIFRAPDAIRADLAAADRAGVPVGVHGRRVATADVVRVDPPPAPPPPSAPATDRRRGRPPRAVFRPTRAGAAAWLAHAGRALAEDLARLDIDHPETPR